jgi:hypothetical protein
MSDFDFRKAYAAEVKASAESKKRCNDLIEWSELQRQTAISSHAVQLRNTLAFKANVDALVKAMDEIAAMDPNGIRADDLGRAARIATDALATAEASEVSDDR